MGRAHPLAAGEAFAGPDAGAGLRALLAAQAWRGAPVALLWPFA